MSAQRSATHASAGPSDVADECAQRLYASWPGRREQITRLLRYLRDPHIILPLLVQGGPSTGKTAVVRWATCCAGNISRYYSE